MLIATGTHLLKWKHICKFLVVKLNSKQINLLDRHIDEFKAASFDVQEQMIKRFLKTFKSTSVGLKTVCVPSAALGCSQTVRHFPAYPSAPLRKNKIGRGTKSDGWRRVHILLIHGKLQLKEKFTHSEEIALIAYHIGILTRQLPNFLAADTNQQEKIVQEAADKIKRIWTGVDFPRGIFIKVCKLSAKHKFSNSQMFLAYMPIPVWQSQTDQVCIWKGKMVILWSHNRHEPRKNL